MSTVDPFDEIVRSTETRVQQMKPGWEELKRMSRKHPKKMAELLYEDGLYWWRVYRRRHRKLEKTFRKLSRRVRAESRPPLAGFKRLLAEITSLLNSGEVVKAEKVLEEVRLRNSRIAPLFAAQDEAEEALDKAEKDLRWEEFPLRAGFMAAQEAARNDKDPYSAFCRGYVTARRDREPDFLLAWMPSRFLEPVEKRTTLAQLIGHASARINLTYHRKLREKWKKESVDPRARFHSELPGAVANAWAAWEEKPRDDRGRFLGYVDEALGDLLSEADRLLKRLPEANEGEEGPKKPRLKVRSLGTLPPEEVLGDQGQSDQRDRGEGELRRPRVPSPEGDEALTEFEYQETLRQQISQLRGYVQRAEFSAREAQVYQLDMRTSFNTVVIACELDIDAGTVRGLRKRYQDKLRKAAGL